MKFAIERTISHTHKDRVVIITKKEDYLSKSVSGKVIKNIKSKFYNI